MAQSYIGMYILGTGVRWNNIALLLQQPQMVANRAIGTAHKFPLKSGLVEYSHLAETVVHGIKNSSDVLNALTITQSAVTFDVTGHTVDDVGHGCAGVCVVGIVVNNGGLVDGAVRSEWV